MKNEQKVHSSYAIKYKQGLFTNLIRKYLLQYSWETGLQIHYGLLSLCCILMILATK